MDFKLKKSELNFKVYAVDTKPTAPGANNDIAVITSVPMTNWIMSPDGPSGIPRSDGDVWIQYSVAGNTFNALKNNTMMIATISAWQYVDGAWMYVEAVSYQDDEWVDWMMNLYDNGREGVSWTGAWTENAGNLCGTGSRINYVYHYTAEKIDVSNFSKLTMYLDVVSGSGSDYESPVLGIASAVTSSNVTPIASVKVPAWTNGQTISLENLPDGEYYIYLQAPRNANSDAKAYVYKVWLE